MPYWLLKVACETIYVNMQKHTKEYPVWLLEHTCSVGGSHRKCTKSVVAMVALM